MKRDIQVFDLIKQEQERQSSGLELIASENYVSDEVLAAMGSICTNKYAEGYPGKTRLSSWPSTASVPCTMRNTPMCSLTPAPRPIWP